MNNLIVLLSEIKLKWNTNIRWKTEVVKLRSSSDFIIILTWMRENMSFEFVGSVELFGAAHMSPATESTEITKHIHITRCSAHLISRLAHLKGHLYFLKGSWISMCLFTLSFLLNVASQTEHLYGFSPAKQQNLTVIYQHKRNSVYHSKHIHSFTYLFFGEKN